MKSETKRNEFNLRANKINRGKLNFSVEKRMNICALRYLGNHYYERRRGGFHSIKTVHIEQFCRHFAKSIFMHNLLAFFLKKKVVISSFTITKRNKSFWQI